jgi:hypothetical protein
MTVGEQLDELVNEAAWSKLSGFLDGLSADGVEAARRWYRQGRRDALRLAQEAVGPADAKLSGAGCVQLLAVRLAPSGRKAAEWFGWELWGEYGGPAEAVVLRRLAGRGREWCAEFVQAASERTFRDREQGPVRVVRYCMPLIAHHGLSMPTGTTYVVGWAEYYQTASAYATSEGSDPVHLERQQRWLTAAGTVGPIADTTLAEAWGRDPVVAEALSACFAIPGLVGRFAAWPHDGWYLGQAAAALVAGGQLDRERVLADCFAALTRPESASTHKAIASALTGVQVVSTDLKDRIALAQGVMATAHGSVTAVLLPVLVEAVSSPEELDELAATVFARKEKKQKSELLRALTSGDAVARFGRDGVVAGLIRAAAVEDETLVVKARAGLARVGVEVEPAEALPVDGLWTVEMPVVEARPLGATLAGPLGLTAEVSGLAAEDLVARARILDAVIRWAYSDLVAAKVWLQQHASQAPEHHEVVLQLINWARGDLTPKVFAKESEVLRSAEREPEYWQLTYRPASSAFAYLHGQEALLRAGRIPYLLSTPSYDNGVLGFDHLVERIRRYGSTPCGPLDLFQALLRLEPVPVERLDALPAGVLPIELPMATSSGLLGRLIGRRAVSAPDAISVIRRWVQGGGLPGLVTGVDEGKVRVEVPELPVDLALFPDLPPGLVTGHDPGRDDGMQSWQVTPATSVAVCPRWPDLLAAKLADEFEQASKYSPHWLRWLATRDAGVGAHYVLVVGLAYPDEQSRLLSVDALLVLIGQGGFAPELFTAAALARFRAGSLPLARTSAAWEQAILGGALRSIWPTVIAVLDEACRAARRPTGLAELIALVRRYLPAVPEPVVPPAVRALAESKGSTKAVVEARALVAASEGVRS